MGTLVVSHAWVPFVDTEVRALIGAQVLIVLGYTVFRMVVATRTSGGVASGVATARRVRQQYRLVSRSWVEWADGEQVRWVPVYFDPALVTLVPSEGEMSGRALCVGGHRVYPSGRVRASEPVGRLIDNPTRPDPEGVAAARTAARWPRRLLLDAQSAVVAPFVALFWIYVADGGILAFAATAVLAATTATWLAAIRGSDPS
ncbi:hypothetical protein [Nocardia sp. NPDC050406]|uniref:hypothetical protein n=1 Tax=Nocardia sp. NPDC050406 TaxID=3364318 RepID=UPI003790C456